MTLMEKLEAAKFILETAGFTGVQLAILMDKYFVTLGGASVIDGVEVDVAWLFKAESEGAK